VPEAGREKQRVVRVEIELSDGTIRRLTGDQANEWDRACAGIATVAAVHGSKFPRFQWEEVRRT